MGEETSAAPLPFEVTKAPFDNRANPGPSLAEVMAETPPPVVTQATPASDVRKVAGDLRPNPGKSLAEIQAAERAQADADRRRREALVDPTLAAELPPETAAERVAREIRENNADRGGRLTAARGPSGAAWAAADDTGRAARKQAELDEIQRRIERDRASGRPPGKM
jgi:hypothetical protein